MENEKNKDLKNALTGTFVIILYSIFTDLLISLLKVFNINYNNFNTISKCVFVALSEIILTLIIILIYKNDFIPNFKDFIKNIKSYFDKYIKYWFLTLGLMIMSNLIITLFTTSEISNNQEMIVEAFKKLPIYTIIVTIVVAPFLEELVFRMSFRKIFAHSNILFIFFSGFIFGGLHVITSLTSLNNLLFIIPYSIPGFMFAYLYTKSNNIMVPIMLHFIHNSVMMLMQLIVIFIK